MKLEQAARQALEALKLFGTDDMAYIKSEKAITALREALAEPQVDWKEEALRLGGLNAKHVGELRKLEAEQAEQEPVAIDKLARACNLAGIEYKDFLRIKAHLPIAAPVQQAEQEPVAVVDPFYIRQLDDELELGTKLYAAPVRTKDLTDAEIATLVQRNTIDGKIMPFALCEAVIAADREKNK